MPTKQFKWIDRDTAARDLLQLVYHAPPQIAEQAIKLLTAIRSTAIMPELKAMFLDEEYDVRQRREIFEVICGTPGDFDFSDFEPVMGKVFDSYNYYAYALKLIKNHPVNSSWILHDIGTKEQSTQLYVYLQLLPYRPELATEPILKSLSENEDLLDNATAFCLHQYGNETIQGWMQDHRDKIMYLWLKHGLNEERTQYWKRLHDLAYLYEWLGKWPELKIALSELKSDWVLKHLQGETPTILKLILIRLLPLAPQTVFELLLKAFEEKRILLDLEIAGLLHQYGDETVQTWLQERWDELIYLCLIDSVGFTYYAEKVRIVCVLEKWPELKESLFNNSPTIVEEYNQKKATYNIGNLERITDPDIQSTSIWQFLEERRKIIIEPNTTVLAVDKFSSWVTMIAQSESDILKIAVQVFFLGTVIEFDNHASMRLKELIKDGGDIWRQKDFLFVWDEHRTFAYTPLRFEAAYALRNHAKPYIWELLIELFFARSSVFGAITSSFAEDYILNWISRMTDILSGVEPELPDEEIPLNARPWFRALVKQNPA